MYGQRLWRSSQSGSLLSHNFCLSRALRAEKGMVLIQVSCDELWEISFTDHLQEHVCCCVKRLFSPAEEWWLISSWKNYVTLHLHLVWYLYSRSWLFSPYCLQCSAIPAKQRHHPVPSVQDRDHLEHPLSKSPKTLGDRCIWWRHNQVLRAEAQRVDGGIKVSKPNVGILWTSGRERRRGWQTGCEPLEVGCRWSAGWPLCKITPVLGPHWGGQEEGHQGCNRSCRRGHEMVWGGPSHVPAAGTHPWGLIKPGRDITDDVSQ